MKKVFKIFIILIGILLVFYINCSKIYAIDKQNPGEIQVAQISVKDILQKGKNFIGYGKNNQIQGLTEEEVAEEFVPVGRILVLVATGVLMIVAVIMGIKWITANPEQQAKLKGQLWGLIFAIFVVFGGVGIWQFVRLVMSKIGDGP